MSIIKKSFSALLTSMLILFISGCSLISNTNPIETNDNPEQELTNNEKESNPLESLKDTDTEKEISFYAVGDNLIHDNIIEYAQADDNSYDFKPIYQNITEDVQAADLSFINQESIIGGDDLGLTGYPSFNTPSNMVENLMDVGFNIVGGSNNHSLDRGTNGIQNTLSYWEEYENEVLFTGVFNSKEERDDIAIVEVDGVNFSILTYTYGTNGIEPEYPYLLNYLDPDLIKNDVKKAKEKSDFVIVSAHWGDEHALEPNQMQEEYAQLFADLEVDLVVGTHSHTIQPIEWVEGVNGNETLVIYSLGNLIASTTSDINMLGGSIHLNFMNDDDKYYIDDIKFVPLVIHYEAATEGDIESRTDFKIHKLKDYEDELADQHALNDYEDNIVDPSNYIDIVHEVIDEEFLE